jgi:large subunit ribosomal protein L4
VLLVLGRDDEVAYRSFRNLPDVQLLLASELNAYDVLCSDWVVFTRATLPGADEPVAAPEPATAAEREPEPAVEEAP